MEEIKEQPEVTKKEKKPKTFRRGVLTGVLCSLLVMALILGGLVFALRGSLGTLADLNLSKLQYISTLVHHYYYEDVDEEALAEGIYKGYMEGLDDPYSVYYTAQEYEDMMIDTTGNYAGIGAVLTKDTTTGQVRIVNVYDDSRQQRQGFRRMISSYLWTDTRDNQKTWINSCIMCVAKKAPRSRCNMSVTARQMSWK